jgi:VCBS repeat protein/IPT/TIG domain-containing protein
MSVRYKSVGIGLLLLIFAFGSPRVFGQTPNPIPLINMPVMPASAPGGAGFELTINGTGFVSNSVANWNGNPRATIFGSASQLTATILASDVANFGTYSVTVTNPGPGGGTSNVMYFTVTNPTSTVPFAAFYSPAQSGPLVAADFNGDGKVDLAIGSGAMNLAGICIELGAGNGTFESPICLAQTTTVTSLIAADFNGDGKLDLAGVDLNGLHVWLGNGDGTFQNEQDFRLATGNQPAGQCLAAGDFNGDGKLDLVVGSVSNGAPGMVSIFLGNGDGTFQSPLNTGSGEDVFSLAVGDFNGDSNLDVVTNNALFLGNGDGTLQAPQSFRAPSGTLTVTGNFNSGSTNLTHVAKLTLVVK